MNFRKNFKTNVYEVYEEWSGVKAVIITTVHLVYSPIGQNQFNYLIKRVSTKVDVLHTTIRDSECEYRTASHCRQAVSYLVLLLPVPKSF